MKLDPSSASFTPNLDEGCLVLGELDCTEISKLCFRDAVAYLRYKSQLECFYKFLDPIWDSPTHGISEAASSFGDKLKNKLMNESTHWSACLQHAVSPGQKEMGDIMDHLLSPASKVPNNWFEVYRRGNGFCLLSPSRLSSMLQRKLELT
ncbi:uncharacterized protein LOC110736917 isoform X2 [Chenopodium quinoa]|nr:uncharacterized protein LOC110736917 isoform X2 [Chenopodium quinoa]